MQSANENSDFFKTAAATTGLSVAEVERYVRVGERLNSAVIHDLRGTFLEDDLDALEQFSELTEADQRKVAAFIKRASVEGMRKAEQQA